VEISELAIKGEGRKKGFILSYLRRAHYAISCRGMPPRPHLPDHTHDAASVTPRKVLALCNACIANLVVDGRRIWMRQVATFPHLAPELNNRLEEPAVEREGEGRPHD
jgi:hypothetical protein